MSLLRELYLLADRQELIKDVEFETLPCPFRVRITEEGGFEEVVERREPAPDPPPGKRKAGKAGAARKGAGLPVSVPRPFEKSTVPGAARFLVDTVFRVFPVPTGDPAADRRAAASRKTFWEQVTLAAEFSGSPLAAAVDRFGRALAADDRLRRRVARDLTALKPAAGDRVAFEVGGFTPTACLQFRDWYPRHLHSLRVRAAAAGGKARIGFCQVSWQAGRYIPAASGVKVRGLDGGPSTGVTLVSANQDAFEAYGFDGAVGTGVSQEAYEGFSRAATGLATGTLFPGLPTRLRLAGLTILVWPDGGDPGRLLAGVRYLTRDPNDPVVAAGDGLGPAHDWDPGPGRLHFAALRAGQGRAAVHGYFAVEATAARRALSVWEADLERVVYDFVSRGERVRDRFPLWEVLAGLGDKVSPAEATAVLVAAVRDPAGPVPPGLVARAARALIDNPGANYLADARLAFARLAYNRNRLGPHLETALDTTRTDAGYLLGRLFCCLCYVEALERMWGGRDRGHHAYGAAAPDRRRFSDACKFPGRTIPPMVEKARVRIAGLYKMGRGGAATNRTKELEEILGLLVATHGGIPGVLGEADRLAFPLGDAAQQTAYRAAARKGAAARDTTNPATTG